MKQDHKFFLLVAAFFMISAILSAKGDADMSASATINGDVEYGLRILPVVAGIDEYVFEAYRGDYVVFSFQDNELHNIRIPDLEIDAQLPKPPEEKPYLKMKVVGTFDIYIDDARGIISVLQYDEPQYQEITSQEAAALIENIEPLILDVRTGSEYAEGHLSNAVLLPVQELESRLGEVFTNKDAPIFVYCKSGNRSTVASKILIDNGFTNVINLRHGILDWQKEDLPIVAP